MRLIKLISILLLISLTFAFKLNAQENEGNKEIEEVKSHVESMDENLTALLGDVAGLKKIKISGYLQINFEKSEASKGFFMNPYDSTDFVQARFRVRRSRIKVAYDAGITQFVVQGDFSNAGFELKDAYLSLTCPWTKAWDFQAGVFNRPNYEVEYSSSQRESMERSLVVRTLYPGERDLGIMATIHPNDWFKLQLAGFNNTFQGTYKQNGPNFNNEPLYFMARLTKEFAFQDLGLGLDLGAHLRYGNVVSNTNKLLESDVATKAAADTVSLKKGDKVGRTWFGFEAQLFYDLFGGMKLMGEYIMGNDVNQLGTAGSKTNGPAIRKRSFNGFYVMLVKNITEEFQFAVKYDSYNPNTKIDASKIDNVNELTVNTLGLGLHNYTFENIRISLWYDMITTKTKTGLIEKDPIDNLLTVRFQYKF
ncbi:MAG: porin [Bacteroidota bacterium]